MQKALRLQKQKLRSGSDDASDGASTVAPSDVESLAKEYDARQSAKREVILENARDGRLCLSEAEEREARKIEKKLRDIASLQEKLNRGCTLEKLQLEKIRLKDSLESTTVMLKIRAGALRPALASPAAPAPAAQDPALALPAPAPALALPAQAKPEDGESPVEMPAKPEGPTLSQMVATIRGELGLDDSLTTFQVLHEAHLQVGIPQTGTVAQQASCLYRELTSA